MGVYIKGMEMPKTGCYFVRVDNSNGEDKTVITVARRIGNTDARYIIGFYELVPVPPHIRLLWDKHVIETFSDAILAEAEKTGKVRATSNEIIAVVSAVPTVIPAESCKEKGE